MGQHSPKMGQHSPKMGPNCPQANIAPRWAHIAPSRSPLSPQHGPWPAVARKRLNPARGPRGPVAVALPKAFSPLCRRPQKPPRFTVFFAVPIFLDLVAQDGSAWANIDRKTGQHSHKMGQHSPKMGPNCPQANIAPRWAHIAPSRSPLSPQHGPWPAVARKRLNPARGPQGGRPCRRPPPQPRTIKIRPGIAARHLSEGERGCRPCRRPPPPPRVVKKSLKIPAFYGVFCCSHFLDLVA